MQRAISNLAALALCGALLAAVAGVEPTAATGDSRPASSRALAATALDDVLESLPEAEAARFLAGADPSEVTLEDGRTLRQALAELGLPRSIPWWTIDSGGGSLAGFRFSLRGTVGQPEPGPPAVAGSTVTGGFWADTGAGKVFADGFESGGTGAWSTTVP